MTSLELKQGELYFNREFLHREYEYDYVNVMLYLGVKADVVKQALSNRDYIHRIGNTDGINLQNYFINQLKFTFLVIGTLCVKTTTLEPVSKEMPKFLAEQAKMYIGCQGIKTGTVDCFYSEAYERVKGAKIDKKYIELVLLKQQMQKNGKIYYQFDDFKGELL